MTATQIAVTVRDSAGATATTTATANVSTGTVFVNVGETAILAGHDNGNANAILAQSFSLSVAGQIQSISYYCDVVGGQIRLAVYNSAANYPSTKVAETAAFTPTLGWNTRTTLTQPTLQPGTYFYAQLPQTNVQGSRMGGSGGINYWLPFFTFGTMPPTFPAGASFGSLHWSVYGTFLQSGAPAVLPPVISSVSVVPDTAAPGVSRTITINATDPGGNLPLTYTCMVPGSVVTPVAGQPNQFKVSVNATTQGTVTVTNSLALKAQQMINIWTLQASGGGFPAVYQGSPNITISAINTGGGIVLSRSSGQLPAFVSVSASAITCTGTTVAGTVNPYEDLEYSWSFGDGSGVETFTSYAYPTSTVNSNSAQTGPEAAYCYRTAGTFTITLNIRGKNGSGFTTASVTATFTSSAYSASGGEIYVDSAAAGGGNGTIGSPFNSITDINTQANIANSLIHIKKGSSFTGGTGINVLASPMRIDTYGSGAKPVIAINTGSVRSLNISAPNSDVVVSGLAPTLITSGTTPDGVMGAGNPSGTGTMANIYIDNCDISCTATTPEFSVVYFMDYADSFAGSYTRCGIWGGSITNASGGGTNAGIYSMGYQWSFVYGVSISGARLSGIGHDHHIYPQTREHSCYRYINFGTGVNCNFCINGNYDNIPTGGTLQYAQWMCVSDCNLSNVSRGLDNSNGNEDPASSRFKNVVLQRSQVTALSNGLCTGTTCETRTIRDLYCWVNGTAGADIEFFAFTGCGGDARYQTYRNNVYHDTSGAGGADSGEIDLRGNNFTNQPQIITDNKFQDMRSVAEMTQLKNGFLAALQNTGTVWDRNTYWYPNASTVFVPDDAGGGVIFSSWKSTTGFDANSTNANPNWPDPANGNFG